MEGNVAYSWENKGNIWNVTVIDLLRLFYIHICTITSHVNKSNLIWKNTYTQLEFTYKKKMIEKSEKDVIIIINVAHNKHLRAELRWYFHFFEFACTNWVGLNFESAAELSPAITSNSVWVETSVDDVDDVNCISMRIFI